MYRHANVSSRWAKHSNAHRATTASSSRPSVNSSGPWFSSRVQQRPLRNPTASLTAPCHALDTPRNERRLGTHPKYSAVFCTRSAGISRFTTMHDSGSRDSALGCGCLRRDTSVGAVNDALRDSFVSCGCAIVRDNYCCVPKYKTVRASLSKAGIHVNCECPMTFRIQRCGVQIKAPLKTFHGESLPP
jgi:hypothetical protein